jgi:hypothetical protein
VLPAHRTNNCELPAAAILPELLELLGKNERLDHAEATLSFVPILCTEVRGRRVLGCFYPPPPFDI